MGWYWQPQWRFTCSVTTTGAKRKTNYINFCKRLTTKCGIIENYNEETTSDSNPPIFAVAFTDTMMWTKFSFDIPRIVLTSFCHDKNNEIRSVAVILCVTPAWLPYLRRIRPVDVMDPFNADLSCIFCEKSDINYWSICFCLFVFFSL